MKGTEHAAAAAILKRSASGLAGFAASALVDGEDADSPEVEATGGADGFPVWKEHLTQRILELAAAVESRNPQIFIARVTWAKRAFLARGQDVGLLERSLRVLRQVVEENFPESAGARVLQYLDLSIDALGEETTSLEESVLDATDPHSRLALEVLEVTLSGDPRAGIDRLLASLGDGVSPQNLYANVLLPMQREVGQLWHLGKLSITEEHLVTTMTRRAMTLIAHTAPRATPNGKTVVLAAVAGNTHDLGLQAVANLFELAGWKALCLGADVPAYELPPAISIFDADLLVLSAVLSLQIESVRSSIAAVRAECDPIPIMVGGSAFGEMDNPAEDVGADGFVSSIGDAVSEGGSLLKS